MITCEAEIALTYHDAWKTLQHTATHCITVQHTATHCNTLQHNEPMITSEAELALTHNNDLRGAKNRC